MRLNLVQLLFVFVFNYHSCKIFDIKIDREMKFVNILSFAYIKVLKEHGTFTSLFAKVTF